MVRTALVTLFLVLPGHAWAVQPTPPSAEAVDRMLLIAKDPPQDRGTSAVQSAELRLRMGQLQTQQTRRNPWGWLILGMCFHLFAVLAVLYLNSHARANAAGRA